MQVCTLQRHTVTGRLGFDSVPADIGCLFTALQFALYDDADEIKPDHPLGGRDLRWDEVSEAVEWTRRVLEQQDVKIARTCVMNAIDIEVPKRDEAGSLIEDAVEWLDDHYPNDWADRFEEKFAALFDERELRDDDSHSVAEPTAQFSSAAPCTVASPTTRDGRLRR